MLLPYLVLAIVAGVAFSGALENRIYGAVLIGLLAMGAFTFSIPSMARQSYSRAATFNLKTDWVLFPNTETGKNLPEQDIW